MTGACKRILPWLLDVGIDACGAVLGMCLLQC